VARVQSIRVQTEVTPPDTRTLPWDRFTP